MTGLNALPPDLASFRADHLDAWRTRADWETVGSAVVTALGVAREPVAAATVARWAGLADLEAVRHWCDVVLRPFLTVIIEVGAPSRYGVRHGGLRSLMLGHAPVAGPAGPRRAGDDLQDRIIDGYLSIFGGAALPDLCHDPGLAGVDGGYPLRHLAAHLVRAGRWAELDRLLRTTSGTGQRRANAWFVAHEHHGSAEGFLDDVHRAARHAAGRTDADLTADRPAPSLGDEVRYGLITASAYSLTHQLATDRLERLLLGGRWLPRRALERLRHLPSPRTLAQLLPALPTEQRRTAVTEALAPVEEADARWLAVALTGLASALPAADRRRPVLIRALDAAEVADPFDRDEVLTRLAPLLPAELLPRALDAAVAVRNESWRPAMLAALAPYLPADLAARALDAAVTSPGEQARADALAGLAPRLSPDLLVLAWAAAAAITDESVRVEALTALAPWLPHDHAARVLATANAVADASGRASVLTALAPRLPVDRRREALADAVAAATAVTGEPWRSEALTGLVPYLPPDRRRDIAAQVLGTAEATGDDRLRAELLELVVPHLAADQFDAAWAAAGAIAGETPRVRAMRALYQYLSPAQLDAAVAAATALELSGTQVWALTGLAPHLPAGRRREVVTRALTVAATITDEQERATALTRLAALLAGEQSDRALAIAVAIRDASARSVALIALAAHLPARLLEAGAAGAARTDPSAFTAYAERVQQLEPTGGTDDPVTWVRLAVLRQALRSARRPVLLAALAQLGPFIGQVGGTTGVAACVEGVEQAATWWGAVPGSPDGPVGGERPATGSEPAPTHGAGT